MIRAWLFAAAITGFLSVAGGALAAHLPGDGRSAELLRTGGLYGMVHAAALVAVSAIACTRDRREYALIVAGWGFAVGMTVFSLSLFGLALTGIAWLGLVTPFGGVGLLAGWAALGLYAVRRER
ncbi:MAG: DUF423 domain-containing protein [Alphaproteobacteria bacterium]|nr:DUF423 domain-containing protein [Alphaproteobacteria bacterium]